MKTIVFLLVLYAGTREGYITVPNLPTEAQCVRLAKEIIGTKKLMWGAGEFSCHAYEVLK